MLIPLAAALLLHAAPSGPGTWNIEIKPATAELLVDGKKKGTGAKPMVLKLTAGKHVFRVTNKGDAHEEEVVVKAGEKKTWKWEFEGPPEPEEKKE